jgi:hypothetical protein
MYCRTAYTVCAITEALNAFGAHYRCDLSAEITPAKILGPDVKPRDRLVPSYEVGASRPTIEEVRFAGDLYGAFPCQGAFRPGWAVDL